MPPPEQLVPRRLRLGVRERMRADGRVESPLDPASLDGAIAMLWEERSRRSRSATFTPSATRATSRRPRRRFAGAARRLRLAVVRGAAADQGVRAGLDDDRQRLCRAGPVALSGAAGGAAARSRLSWPDPDHPVAWRGGADRGGRAARRRRRAVRAGGRGRRQRLRRAPARRRQSDPVRHGRHQHRHQLDRRRRARRCDRTGGSAGQRIALNCLDIARSAPAAARSPGSMPAASCMSARRAPARCRARPATARAAPRDRDRRQSGAGLSRPGELSRRRRRLDRAAAERQSTASPPASGSTGWPRREASTGSSTPTWPRGCGSFRCAAGSIRAGSRCSRSAARPGCTQPTSPASSACRGSSCRASRRYCRPGGCSPPICASRSRAAISAIRGRSTAAR